MTSEEVKRFPIFNKVRKDHAVNVYIEEQNNSMKALHYTEHGFAHVKIVAHRTRYILDTLGKDDHTIDLGITAALLHDIGNIVNRVNHSQSGALMAFQILNGIGLPPEDVARVVCAIGNHDEGTGEPVSIISAALILADKSDVRRSRVQEEQKSFDIHDRVNYSVTESRLKINKDHNRIKLKLSVDTRYSKVGEYFEIFLDRMLLCKRAAEFLGLEFHLIINEQTLI
ncbi:MAG: HD domain-containing protein [Eubacteriales bacterium]|jgi:metal-dependent HD superfamily phosphatase/phosphodiesterase